MEFSQRDEESIRDYLELTRWNTRGPATSDLSSEERNYLLALHYLPAPLSESGLMKYFSHPPASVHGRVESLRKSGLLVARVQGTYDQDLELTDAGRKRAQAIATFLISNRRNDFHGAP